MFFYPIEVGVRQDFKKVFEKFCFMGEVIDSVGRDEKRLLKVVLDSEEAKNLRGHREKIHIFSEDNCVHKVDLLERGNKREAKYFKIPRELKKRRQKITNICYQRVQESGKVFFIFTLNL